LARELTKKFETVLGGPASEVLAILQQDSNQTKGEFVLMIAGVAAHEKSAEADPELQALMVTLMQELPLKQAVSLAVKLTGARKNEVYQLALALQDSDD
jgi:16S rRNA (cytidine1402-2'-O)-methyltransferase